MYGFGYKLRDKRKVFRPIVSDTDIAEAYRHADKGTRAHLRTDIMRQYNVSRCDWHYVEISDDERMGRINLFDVKQSEFNTHNIATKQTIKKITM